MAVTKKSIIYSNYGVRPPEHAEKNDGFRITTTIGLMSVAEQFERAMLSGEMIESLRHAQYDYQNGIPITDDMMDIVDPTRKLNFDLSDWSEENKMMQIKLRKEFYEAKAKAERSKNEEEFWRKFKGSEEPLEAAKKEAAVSVGDTKIKKDVSPNLNKNEGL